MIPNGIMLLMSITAQDYARSRDIYKTAISVVPHKQFTFAKLWLQFARFEIRRLDLETARKILGTSIGMCPKEKLFKGYIDLELEVSLLSHSNLSSQNRVFETVPYVKRKSHAMWPRSQHRLFVTAVSSLPCLVELTSAFLHNYDDYELCIYHGTDGLFDS
jgi:hypothetical protein